MSAREIIDQINALPASEKQEVVEWVVREAAPAVEVAREKPRPDMEKLITGIFDKHDELFRKLAQ